jgi:hypothetical protein
MDYKITEEERYLLAKKRLKRLKEFYVHLAAYIVVNLLLTILTIIEKFYDGSVKVIFVVDTNWIWLFWGIGVLLHGLRVFGFSSFVRKGWEERKIKEFMNQNKNK